MDKGKGTTSCDRSVRVCDRLRQIRKSRSLTQREIALSLNLDRTTISKIEHDKLPLSVSALPAYAEAHKMDVRDFVLALFGENYG